MERRLAAILAANVVGYTRLMGQDAAGILACLVGLNADFPEDRRMHFWADIDRGRRRRIAEVDVWRAIRSAGAAHDAVRGR